MYVPEDEMDYWCVDGDCELSDGGLPTIDREQWGRLAGLIEARNMLLHRKLIVNGVQHDTAWPELEVKIHQLKMEMGYGK